MPELKTPGPEHPITLTRTRGRVRALFEGHLLADSDKAILLREAGQPDRYYFPRESVETEVLKQGERRSWSSYMGQAAWFTIYRDRKVVDDVAWSYENPPEVLQDIGGMISFDLDDVDIQRDERAETDDQRARMSEYIRHTDSGAGSSQAEHWPANVSRPSDLLGEDETQP
jgi:uncharacterized protein (DUF427 family)